MRYVMDSFRQGDLYFLRVEKLPKEITEDMAENGKIVVGHSETGHHHVVVLDKEDDPNVRMYSGDNPLVSWLEVNRPATLEHMRSFDTHAPITIPPGTYKVHRQREYVPEGFRRVQD